MRTFEPALQPDLLIHLEMVVLTWSAISVCPECLFQAAVTAPMAGVVRWWCDVVAESLGAHYILDYGNATRHETH